MNKKGNLFTAIFVIASLAAFAIFLLVVGYTGNQLGTKLQTVLNDSTPDHFANSINKSLQTTVTISTQTLSSLWFIAFGGLILLVLVSAWFTTSYPIMLPVFIILLITTIIVGIAMSNAYEQVAANVILSTAAAQQASVGFVMSNLPYVALIIGLLSILIIFVKPGRDKIALM